ncbi:MAG: SH3 domain-containing protein [Minicystis sp.]
MAKDERPLKVEIPPAGRDQPIWSRVGIVGVAGFLIGIAWPKVAGVKIGPAVPADLAAKVEATASPSASAMPRVSASAVASATPSATPSAAASAEPEAPPSGSQANQEMVAVGQGKIVKCYDKKDKKIDDCEKLLFDPIAVKRLRALAACPSALGLSGKMGVLFEVDFGKKEVVVKKTKKNSLPSATVSGIVKCAAREFAQAPLDEVPHKHRHYVLEYPITFYPPGKHPEGAAAGDTGDGEPAAGSTTSEADASGSAIVAWDTAPVRKEPKDGEVVHRFVRGTKVKIVGKQNDWYKIESNGKVGWVYRGAIGL